MRVFFLLHALIADPNVWDFCGCVLGILMSISYVDLGSAAIAEGPYLVSFRSQK